MSGVNETNVGDVLAAANMDITLQPGGNAPYWTTEPFTGSTPPPAISGAPVYASTYVTATHTNAFTFFFNAEVGMLYSFGVRVWLPPGTSASLVQFRGDYFTSYTTTQLTPYGTSGAIGELVIGASEIGVSPTPEVGEWVLISGTGYAGLVNQPVVVEVVASVGAVVYFTAPQVNPGPALNPYQLPAAIGEQNIGAGLAETAGSDSLVAAGVDVIPSPIPPSHIPPALSLTPDSYVDFYAVQLYQGATINLCEDIDRMWMGTSWTGIGLTFSGYGMYGTSQVSRPTLKAVNPDGVFSTYVAQRQFDYATITRYRVLLSDVLANNPVYLSQNWVVSRVQSCTHTSITLELRSYLDTPNFTLPSNQYTPPKFPMVTMP